MRSKDVGNKIDLEDKRQITKEEGKKLAEENNKLFFETGAKEGNNIQEIFSESVYLLIDKNEKEENKLREALIKIKIEIR